MNEAEIELLLSPLAGDAPCGPDLQFDAETLALEQAAAGQLECEYGDTLIPAKDPDWAAVHAAARQLAARTRDLRLAVWLVRSGARTGGLDAAVGGLQLLRGLLQRHWDAVHPQIEPGSPPDSTARMNALRPLVHIDAVLADLRAARLTPRRGALTVREIELALGRAEPRPGEPLPTEDGVLAGVAAACAECPALPATVRAACEAVQAITTLVEAHDGAGQAPDLKPLKLLMQPVATLFDRLVAAPAAPATVPDNPAARAAPAPAAAAPAADRSAIACREDAIRALDRICEWIEHNEPASPAPLFIRRSQSLLRMRFVEIIRELVPDGLKQIEHFAGRSDA